MRRRTCSTGWWRLVCRAGRLPLGDARRLDRWRARWLTLGRAHARGALGASRSTLALVVGVVGLAAHHGRARSGKRPNMLVLAVDSLRADRVFAPDAARRFPTLAALARAGVRFREAHVTVPRTFPSFVTLLTGRYPHHHGIRHMFPSAAQRRGDRSGAAVGAARGRLSDGRHQRLRGRDLLAHAARLRCTSTCPTST